MGFFNKKELNEEALRVSCLMTYAQALDATKQIYDFTFNPNFEKTFSSVVGTALISGNISKASYDLIKYSPFNVSIEANDSGLYNKDIDFDKFMQNLFKLSSYLSAWRPSNNDKITNHKHLFSGLLQICQEIGISENDEVTMSFLYIVSLGYLYIYQNADSSKKDKVGLVKYGSFYAMEMINFWILNFTDNGQIET